MCCRSLIVLHSLLRNCKFEIMSHRCCQLVEVSHGTSMLFFTCHTEPVCLTDHLQGTCKFEKTKAPYVHCASSVQSHFL